MEDKDLWKKSNLQSLELEMICVELKQKTSGVFIRIFLMMAVLHL